MMTIIVQNCITKEYLDDSGEWINDASKAKVFRGTIDAYEHCKAHDIPNSQIVLQFGRRDLDLTVPVSANCRDSNQ